MSSAFQPSPMTRLPNETWKHILEFATYVPGELDTVHATTMDTPEESQAAIVKSYEIRRTIVQVCKLWNGLGTPILYRTIILRTIDRPFSSLKVAFKRKTRGPSFADVSYVRRLDIDSESSSEADTPKDLNHLLSMLQRSPRVRIVNLSLDKYTIADTQQFLVKLCDCLTPGLKFLRIELDKLAWPDFFHGRTFSVTLPHHALDNVGLESRPRRIIGAFKVRNTTSPHTSSLSITNVWLASFKGAGWLFNMAISSPDDLNCLGVDGAGKQLTSLEIWEPHDGPILQGQLTAIAKFCPRLHTLVIAKTDREGGFGVMRSFPKLGIRRLGYRITGDRISQSRLGWYHIFELIEETYPSGSSLKEFHVLSPALLLPVDIIYFPDIFEEYTLTLRRVSGIELSYGNDSDVSL